MITKLAFVYIFYFSFLVDTLIIMTVLMEFAVIKIIVVIEIITIFL